MSKSKIALWGFYLLIYISFVIKKCIVLFAPSAAEHNFHQLLLYFDPYFAINYACNVAQVLLTAVHIIPLILYMFDLNVFSKKLWKYLLCARIIFDVLGNTYEWHYLSSVKYISMNYFYILVFISISIYVPSYIASYRYAFVKKDAFS